MEWLDSAKPIDEGWLNQITSSSDMLTAVIDAAKQRASDQAESLRPRYDGDSAVTSVLRNSSAWTDSKHSAEFRNTLQRLELYDDQGGNAPLTLDFARDVFTTLQGQIDSLGQDNDGLQINRADLDFMKQKATRDINALVKSIGLTAYDKVGVDRAQAVAAVASTLLVGVLPFAYAYYSDPTAFFYLGSLAGAYSRTLMLATGLMRNPATSKEQVLEHVKERQLIWAMPALFYSVPAYMHAFAGDHPGDQAARHVADKATAISKSIGFLAAVGIAESLIFMATNHPDWVNRGVTKTGQWINSAVGKPPSQNARFQSGDMRIPTPGADEATPQPGYVDKIEAIRSTVRLGAGLTQSMFEASSKWQGQLTADQRAAAKDARERQNRGEPLSAGQQALLTETNAHLEKLGESEKALLTQARQSMGQLSDTLDLFVGGIKAAVPMISPEQKREKQLVGTALIVAGAVLGVTTSLAALRTPALLTDYIPYYLATELLLATQMSKDTLTRENVARTFGSYFGGTTIALPTSAGNLVTNVGFKEGLWDIVSRTQGPSTAHPSLPVTHHPDMHGADGRINFGVFVAYNVLTALWAGGKAGEYISTKVIDAMTQAVELDNDLARTIDPQNVQQIKALFDAHRALPTPGQPIPGPSGITDSPSSTTSRPAIASSSGDAQRRAVPTTSPQPPQGPTTPAPRPESPTAPTQPLQAQSTPAPRSESPTAPTQPLQAQPTPAPRPESPTTSPQSEIEMDRLRSGVKDPSAARERFHEHWREAATAVDNGRSWSTEQINAFAQRAGYHPDSTFLTTDRLDRSSPVGGFALSPTQMVVLSDAAQRQLRILTLGPGERVGDHPLQPGQVVHGHINSPGRANTPEVRARGGSHRR